MTALPDIGVEVLYLGFLLSLGLALTSREAFWGPVHPAVAFLVGVGLHVSVGTLLLAIQVGVGLRASSLGAVMCTGLIGIGLGACRWGGSHQSPPLATRAAPYPRRSSELLVSSVLLLLVTVITRSTGFGSLSPDSVSYLAGARLFADGRAQLTLMEPTTFEKRMTGLQVLHSPAEFFGSGASFALGPTLLVAVLALTGWMAVRLTERRVSRKQSLLFGGLVVLALAATEWFVSMAAYVNAHLAVAGLVMLLVAVQYRAQDWSGTAKQSQLSLKLIAAVTVAALVLLRPEGTLLAALVLLPGVVRDGGSSPVGWWAWRSLALATVGWQLLVVGSYRSSSVEVPVSVLGTLVLGVVAWMMPMLIRKVPSQHRRRILVAAEAALWLGVIGYAALDTPAFWSSLTATRANLLSFSSGWGVSVPLLLLIAIVGAVAGRLAHVHERTLIRFPVSAFVPLGLLLGFLRGVPYRVGAGDSLNRMWTHILPLVLLLGLLGIREVGDDRRTGSPKGGL